VLHGRMSGEQRYSRPGTDGQAPSVHPDFAMRLVEWGIDSISVNADAIERTRRNVAIAEQRVLLAAARASSATRRMP